MARLPFESVIIDGEAVCLLEDGRPDFHALRSRHGCRDARLIAYDLLGLDGEDLRKLPLHERSKRLEGLVSGNDVIGSPATSKVRKAPPCSGMPARWGSKASCRSGSTQIRTDHRGAQDQVPRTRPVMTGQRRTDVDQRAYELRTQGLTYRAIAKWLGVTLAMARRRVLRHERTLRETGQSRDRSQRSRE
jgi:hypothetical protein